MRSNKKRYSRHNFLRVNLTENIVDLIQQLYLGLYELVTVNDHKLLT